MRAVLLLLLLLGTAVSAEAQPAPWRALPDALADARARSRPTIVYVQAAWCGPCRRLERETFAHPAVAAQLARFSLARLSIDDHEGQHRVGPYRLSEADWAARLGADGTPTVVVLSPDGAVLGRHTGFLPPDGFVSVLDAALAGTTLSG